MTILSPKTTCLPRIGRQLFVLIFVVLLGGPAARADNGVLEKRKTLIELGGYIGVFNPSEGHALNESGIAHQEFDAVAFMFGGRATYLYRHMFGAELELSMAPTSVEQGGFALLYDARVHGVFQYPIWEHMCLFLLAGGSLLGVSSSADVLGDSISPAFHWGIGTKYYLRDDLALRADFRHTVSEGIGLDEANHFEFTVGASWVFGWGIDTDNDGIDDKHDRCPNQAARTASGCPAADSDEDGIPDDRDKCPQQKSLLPDGCPPEEEDRDGDNIPDEQDKCPDDQETFNEFNDTDGCPDKAPTPIKAFNAAIQGRVNFASGRAKIAEKSAPMLDRIIDVMSHHDELDVLVRGHTDNVGDPQKNAHLSLERAQAVKRYLINGGIEASRISVEGVGDTEPLANNELESGRALNRRIEFRVMMRGAQRQ